MTGRRWTVAAVTLAGLFLAALAVAPVDAGANPAARAAALSDLGSLPAQGRIAKAVPRWEPTDLPAVLPVLPLAGGTALVLLAARGRVAVPVRSGPGPRGGRGPPAGRARRPARTRPDLPWPPRA